MKASQFIGLLFTATANAVPITEGDLIARGGLAQALAPGEMLLVNGEKLDIVNETAFYEFVKAEGIALEKPEIDYAWLNFTAPDIINAKPGVVPRDCDHTTSVVTDTTQKFLDWDVQMGPVVRGAGEGVNSFIASGWSVANSVTGSVGVDISFIKSYLGPSLGVDYSKTWTTTTTDQYSTLVKDGKAGVWVTQPWTTRRYGRTFRGCVGSMTQTGTWMADAHDDGSYANSKWVSGFITACIKTAPPLGQHMTRCHGSGNFV
ncbi:hypothetical protein ColLi_03524 [Colletotrichum liriopes]|uniref:Celp0028 effector like protein n=1 Tax=Colletotrichum liriopes TaxID=708192 RepID=A0AA37GGS9_9PEZI|nr:hypothetical protein ColLi_03524 [Colletotrichum liriopes]